MSSQFFSLRSVEGRVICVIIFGIHFILCDTQGITDFTDSNKVRFFLMGQGFSEFSGFGIL